LPLIFWVEKKPYLVLNALQRRSMIFKVFAFQDGDSCFHACKFFGGKRNQFV